MKRESPDLPAVGCSNHRWEGVVLHGDDDDGGGRGVVVWVFRGDDGDVLLGCPDDLLYCGGGCGQSFHPMEGTRVGVVRNTSRSPLAMVPVPSGGGCGGYCIQIRWAAVLVLHYRDEMVHGGTLCGAGGRLDVGRDAEGAVVVVCGPAVTTRPETTGCCSPTTCC